MFIHPRFMHDSAILLTLCGILGPLAASAEDRIAQRPLMMAQSAAPNLLLTVDNSYSMSWAYVPDSYEAYTGTRRIRSGSFNKIHYDPAITYRIPLHHLDDGSLAPQPYSTSFTAAPADGFNPSPKTVTDLSTSTPSNLIGSSNPGVDFINYLKTSQNIPALKDGETGVISAIFNYNSNYKTAISVTRHGNECTALFHSAQPNPIAYCSFTTSSNGTQNYSATLSSMVNRTTSPVPAYYYRFDSDLPGCPTSGSRDDDRCYKLTWVSSTSGDLRADDLLSGRDERQNFANWYSFYRTRLLTTKSSALLAFEELPETIRVGWQALSRSWLVPNETGDNSLRRFSGYQRGRLFSWLAALQVDLYIGTPLLTATTRIKEYAKSDEVWAFDPSPYNDQGKPQPTVQQPEYSCRKNFHVLMTDGMWADRRFSVLMDESSVRLPDGQHYSPRRPYSSVDVTTLADVAFDQWATDLRPNSKNNVPARIVERDPNDPQAEYWNPLNDPATWQHINTYTIGLGLTTSLNDPQLPWFGNSHKGSGYRALLSNTDWPKMTGPAGSRVYDLWHTALNGRGAFYSAENASQMLDAFTDILSDISDTQSTGAAPAVGSSETGELDVFRAQFNSRGWVGELSHSGPTGAAWNASELLDKRAADSRQIYIADAKGRFGLKSFDWDNLDSQQRKALDYNPVTDKHDDLGATRLKFLRGERTAEGTQENSLRKRTSVLGDIINSTPVRVGAPGYSAAFANRIEGAGSDYERFRLAHAERRATVYVGANDGMLHAFNARTGVETFAFIPSAVFANLSQLTAQDYDSKHQYFVDGTPVTADVYFDGDWHTVLVGTLGAGGRGLFALDITDPTRISLLWEHSADDPDFKALGYTLPRPVIARLYSGQWAVVMGNGPSGAVSGAARPASLLILDVASGKLLRQLDAIDPAQPASDNGLSSVALSDFNEDGVAEYAYAGDVQGNLWRFDLFPSSVHALSQNKADPFRRGPGGLVDSSAYLTQFQVSYGGKPLLSTVRNAQAGRHRQPISAPPLLVRHPTQRGYLVIAGTGRYYERTDAEGDRQGSTLYGIWDRHTHGQDTSSAAVERESMLVQQQFSVPSDNPFGNVTPELRTLSRNPVGWYKAGQGPGNAWSTDDRTVAKWGWALNLWVGKDKKGEMIINSPKVRGRSLLVDTLLPGGDPCLGGVSQWLLGIDPSTGGATLYNPFDFNRDGVINGNDQVNGEVISGFRLSSNGSGGFSTAGGTLLIPCLNCGQDGDNGMKYANGLQGRRSWQYLPGDDD
ncbi:MAG: Type IV pilus biogenesis factor PilY1 [Stenotrophomonas maltophilia]|nr:MAG: Type IV pilus biogenesis factor PilY1 [Stenotrophomonas maltophilia]